MKTTRNAITFDGARFARAVRIKRNADGLSLRELSERVQVSPSTLSRVEHAAPLDLPVYVALVRWLNAPFDRFFTFPAGDGPLAPARPCAEEESTLAAIEAHLLADFGLTPAQAGCLADSVRQMYEFFRAENERAAQREAA